MITGIDQSNVTEPGLGFPEAPFINSKKDMTKSPILVSLPTTYPKFLRS